MTRQNKAQIEHFEMLEKIYAVQGYSGSVSRASLAMNGLDLYGHTEDSLESGMILNELLEHGLVQYKNQDENAGSLSMTSKGVGYLNKAATVLLSNPKLREKHKEFLENVPTLTLNKKGDKKEVYYKKLANYDEMNSFTKQERRVQRGMYQGTGRRLHFGLLRCAA